MFSRGLTADDVVNAVRALGTAVFAGMIGVTFFGIFLTPVFFSVITKAFARVPKWRKQSLITHRVRSEEPVH
jgi:hypothetical protein